MLKKGLLLTIIFLLIFSVSGYAYDYTYTQQSGVGFFVGTADKADALEDSNELRQIINDLGALLVHSKMDGLYPKDLTTGGTIQIPEAGLKFSNAPINNDIAAYIAGEMTWQTKAELNLVVTVGTPADSQIGVWTGDGTIEGAASLTYDGSNLQFTGDIGSTGTKITKGWFTDMTVANAIAGDITGNAATVTSFTPASGSLTLSGADALTLTTTAATNVTLPTTGTLMANLEEDTDPDLGGQLQAGAHSINFTEQVLTSGTAIAWNLGNSNKATLTAAHNFTITITAPSGALNAQLIVTQDGTGTRVMDEIVTQSDATIATTDVNTTTEIITVTVDIPTGARIRFKTSAADLPDPLVVDTIYYAIRNSVTEIKVATTKALAHAGTAVDLTDQGTGTHTVQQLVKWTGGTLGILSTTVGSEDILSLTYKTVDKQWYALLSKDFK